MSVKLNILRKLVRELIKREIEEATMTGNIDGGAGPPKTPLAFKKKKKGQDESGLQDGHVDPTVATDYEKVKESVNEAIKPQGYSQLNTMVKHATIYLRDLSKALRKQDDDAVLREVHFLAAQFTTMEKMLKDKKWNAKYNESITINGKKYKPLNENDQSWAKYYSWRNDKSMTPKQKIGMSMREVRDSLQELEKIVFRSIKLKKELKVGSDNYWKSTHSALRRIHERLVKLTGKIANLY
jgi:hypothetical protein|tara:strand:- start:973 stop:1692 length:720 start_codon:yes stop_codon:yes gene_type:complete